MSRLDDSYIYISYIKAPISRCELIKILLKMNNGRFIYNKHVGYVKTKQFSLEIEDGEIVVDGELQKSLKSIECSIKKINCVICIKLEIYVRLFF